MTKDEFLIRLRTLIAAMPKEERDDVMQYYSDYFEDAGPGKEQEVIRQLESPEAVASQVMGGTLPGGQEAQDRDQGGPAYGAPAQGQQRHRNGLRSWWGVLLAICAAPIALPLAIAGAAVLVILALAALLVIGSFCPLVPLPSWAASAWSYPLHWPGWAGPRCCTSWAAAWLAWLWGCWRRSCWSNWQGSVSAAWPTGACGS